MRIAEVKYMGRHLSRLGRDLVQAFEERRQFLRSFERATRAFKISADLLERSRRRQCTGSTARIDHRLTGILAPKPSRSRGEQNACAYSERGFRMATHRDTSGALMSVVCARLLNRSIPARNSFT